MNNFSVQWNIQLNLLSFFSFLVIEVVALRIQGRCDAWTID